ncbi:iso-1-cytochrome c [Neofusicoccum parvum]|nr:iso-1-cytochrome c [Neofusicoccum parvum]
MAVKKIVFTEGDATRGATLYAKLCEKCHAIPAGAPHKFGPTLAGIVGTRAGGVRGYKSSEAMRARGERDGGDGLTWTPQALAEFLADWQGYVPGCRKTFAGVRSASDRNDIVT